MDQGRDPVSPRAAQPQPPIYAFTGDKLSNVPAAGAEYDLGDAPAPYATLLADGGPYHAVGKGLNRATGDVLCWINSVERADARITSTLSKFDPRSRLRTVV